ncbi:MAG: lycopene cyclase domain-containing protein [Candidatus Lokiarchaeota archaeon]|nr:lycopene cyclase domain-containing protein [Candidatus Lokiarchaeota archaeon]MBD3200987.1 lycopene cyclase domain-containing protein [Candidatus Lokiarchaeota archaeon]
MSLYFWLNLLVIIGPILLSFDKKVAFWRRWPPLLMSMIIVSSVFIIWDIIVTEIGHWSFSVIYAGTLKLVNLPIGEWMFFIAVPYATIFIYECVRAYTKDKELHFSRYIFISIGLIGTLPLIFFFNKGYTVLMGIVFLITMCTIGFFGYKKFTSKWTLVALILTYIPFLVFNGIFTYLPIVLYNPDAIIGIRVISIPIEDFFYSFSLISLSMFFYFLFRERFSIKGAK